MMAPLPALRLSEPLRPFAKTAVDFAGSLITIQGRGKARVKRYLCLFTCIQCRAVHLELAFGLDTDSFIRAFKRFINRRGRPELMISDNGTNFVGATGELKEVMIDSYKMNKDLAENGIRWIFNPPGAPHFGGIFEALIKSAKRALNAVLQNADVNDEEMMTILTTVEDLINSRPLTNQSSDIKEELPLTPNSFIRVAEQHGINSLEERRTNGFKQRWKRIQELERHVWRRWMSEIVPTWAVRNKWTQEKESVTVGNLVWILYKTNEYGKWPLAKVKKVIIGEDKKTRVLILESEKGEICRALNKVFPLDIEITDSMRSQGGGNVGELWS
jgi:transposase InsO family protein